MSEWETQFVHAHPYLYLLIGILFYELGKFIGGSYRRSK